MRINSFIFVFYLTLFILTFGFVFSGLSISGGDYVPITRATLPLFMSHFGWCSYLSMGNNCIPIALHYLPLGGLMYILSFLTFGNLLLVEKLVWWFPFFIISFFSIIALCRKVFPGQSLWFLSPLIFIWNTYIFMILGGGQIAGIALGYGFMPVLFYLLINLVEKRSISAVVLYIFALGIEGVFDMRILYIFVASSVLYLCVDFIFHKRTPIGIFKDIAIVLVIPMLGLMVLHSYWILPAVLVRQNPLEQLGSAYSTTGAVKFFSFARLENSLSLLHPNWPENLFGKTYFMKPEFLLLPILAYLSLFIITVKEKTKEQRRTFQFVLYFALLALISAFLSKGANDPFGNIYLWFFTNIPGFQVFRDSTKWYMPIAISYSLLIPFTLKFIQDILNKKLKNT